MSDGPALGCPTVPLWDVRRSRVAAHLESDPARAETRALGRRPPAGPTEGHVSALTTNASGSTLVALTRDAGVAIWDMRALSVVARVDGPSDGQWVGLTSDEASVVARLRSNRIAAWDVTTGERRRTDYLGLLGGHDPLAMSADGARVYAGERHGRLHVVALDDMASESIVVGRAWPGEYPGGWNSVTSVAATSDGSLVATVVNEARVVFWDAQTLEKMGSVDHGWSHSGALGLHLPIARRIVTADYGDTSLHFWDAGTGKRTGSVELQFSPNRVVASPDESLLAVAAFEQVHVLDANSGTLVYTADAGDLWPWDAAFSPDSTLLAVVGSQLTMHDAATGEVVRRINDDAALGELLFSHDGAQVIAGGTNSDRPPRVWDVQTGELVMTLEDTGRVVATPRGLLHGRLVTIPSAGRRVDRWIEVHDVAADARVTLVPEPLPSHPQAAFNGVQFHPGGGLVAVVDRPLYGDRATRFHDATNGELLAISALYPWTFTSDGDHVIARTPEGDTGLYLLSDILRADVPVSVDPRGLALSRWGALRRAELLPNYPSPFNPETWIPFRLAEASDVTVTIHALDGGLLRTLRAGGLPAGDYTARDRALHWDGRDAAGEPAPSGVYVATLRAGGVKRSRSMVIAK